ncbi:Peptidoglycan-binding lysin domain-containing protein [Emticicia oligotrophica DSM 17448]|uniref:Peptidoglycan-binding lysin domain-containing protein n=1 Tax=Emticicia oligotrophica (strain DSM 17448 / CIP 109782 / MTCC 6937 / GPTSA100-15) TaxID=929562 RepID=A0ABN4ARQ3_EMTOG|nr:Peptidoglycan-binding lysin domain-containing protein [Emticicia oligotrophica DSM 17448]
MDLRAFKYSRTLLFLMVYLGRVFCFAHNTPDNAPSIPYEIKFANVTFQLTEVTKYLVETEFEKIRNDKIQLHQNLDKFNLFLPVVEPILKESEVPVDFKFLMVYNKFQSTVEKTTLLESSVFWCLDKAKASDVDLLVNERLDERKHLIASTKGAALCIKRNQVLYRNWGATLFSHLADKKVLSMLEVNKKWAENSFVVLDSPAYSAILQFLAYKLAIEREFPAYKPTDPKIIYEYPYSKGKTLNKISLDLKVEPETLLEYNKWLNTDKVPDTDCNVLVVVPSSRYTEVRTLAELTGKIGLPAKDLGFPILKREENNIKTRNKGGVFYVINDIAGLQADMCDIPVTMAYKAGISIEKFLEYNDIKETEPLRVGQVYYIQSKAGKASVPFHVVREGETLWDISQMYGVKLANLLDYNRFETIQKLQRGRVIWLQTTRPKNKPVEYIEMPEENSEVLENLVVEIKNSEKDIVTPNLSKEENNTIEEFQEKTILPTEVTKTLTNKETENTKIPSTKEFKKENLKSVSLPKVSENKTASTNEELDESRKNTSIKPNLAPQKADFEDEKLFKKHIVKKGETLFKIATNYRVEVSELWLWNSLTSTIVLPGVTLKIKSSK